ncbi:MAG: NUDIX hydrolase [Anaerolineales bacterium]|nr:NUDIX hydrolase [Anaerolineales bacterium]
MQPIIYSANKRPFATSPVAVQAIIVNDQEQILLLSSPHRNRPDEWQTVSGALETEETILDAVLREVREEAGAAVRVRPLGVVHARTFHYDAHVRYAIGIYYLLAYEGGTVEPGDDMRDSQARWWSLAELAQADITLHISINPPWLFTRAIELYRLWRDQDPVLLQKLLD